MAKAYIIKIAKDGSIVSGLYADFLAGLGEISTTRASSVEFNANIQRWVVELRVGPYAGSCLLQTFEKRQDALEAELAVLSHQHELGLIA